MPLSKLLTERDLVRRAAARPPRTPAGELAYAFLVAACVCIVGYPLLVLVFCLGANWVRR